MGQQDAEKAKKRDISDYVGYDLFVLVYVLRGITSEELALSASELALEMKPYIGTSYSARTADRKIKEVLEIQQWAEEIDPVKRHYKKELAQVLYCVYGGRIMTTGNKYKKYYFEPCLDSASMRMLNGTVLTNRFLSQEEKAYLLTRMKLLNMLGGFNESPEEEEREESVSPRPESERDNIFPGDSSRFIGNTIELDRAIIEKYQIEITYGIYDLYENGIDYHRRMENDSVKKYRLNPYALFWCDGHYYLLATYVGGYEPGYMKEEGTPVNFRVDRIVEAVIVEQKKSRKKKAGKDTWFEPVGRERIPSRLKAFFKTDECSKEWFDSEGYCARFPAMRISEYSRLIDCKIECTEWSLQILVDTFGSFIKVKKSERQHGEEELDYNGRKQTFIEVMIEKVEFENMRDYCLAYPEYITPIEPAELVSAVKEKLQAAIARL